MNRALEHIVTAFVDFASKSAPNFYSTEGVEVFLSGTITPAVRELTEDRNSETIVEVGGLMREVLRSQESTLAWGVTRTRFGDILFLYDVAKQQVFFHMLQAGEKQSVVKAAVEKGLFTEYPPAQ